MCHSYTGCICENRQHLNSQDIGLLIFTIYGRDLFIPRKWGTEAGNRVFKLGQHAVDMAGVLCYSLEAKNQLHIVPYARDVGHLGRVREWWSAAETGCTGLNSSGK